MQEQRLRQLRRKRMLMVFILKIAMIVSHQAQQAFSMPIHALLTLPQTLHQPLQLILLPSPLLSPQWSQSKM
jgi:hypothetical protein